MPPVTISGWVGVIIEKIIAGYLERFATDMAVNSRSELATFETVARNLQFPLTISCSAACRCCPVGTARRRSIPLSRL